jgi:hypothetical protein
VQAQSQSQPQPRPFLCSRATTSPPAACHPAAPQNQAICGPDDEAFFSAVHSGAHRCWQAHPVEEVQHTYSARGRLPRFTPRSSSGAPSCGCLIMYKWPTSRTARLCHRAPPKRPQRQAVAWPRQCPHPDQAERRGTRQWKHTCMDHCRRGVEAAIARRGKEGERSASAAAVAAAPAAAVSFLLAPTVGIRGSCRWLHRFARYLAAVLGGRSGLAAGHSRRHMAGRQRSHLLVASQMQCPRTCYLIPSSIS